MKTLSIIERIKQLQEIDRAMVSKLYSLSKMSLIVLTILVMLIAIVLRNALYIDIAIWAVLLIAFIFLRLYNTYLFEKNNSLYSLEVWYKKFLISSLFTAFVASMLGFYFLHYLNAYFQLFVVTALLGLASGSIVSLRADVRIAIAYISIIILPLIISLNFVDTGAKNYALSFILTLYYIGLVSMLLKTDEENQKYKKIKEEKVYLKNIFKEAPLAIFTYNTDLKILDSNNKLSKLFGHSPTSYSNMNLRELPDKQFVNKLLKTIKKGAQSYTGSYLSLKEKDYWIHLNSFPFMDQHDTIIGGIAIMEDKTKEHDIEKNFKFQAEHDSLTELLNRRGFMEYMKRLIANEKHKKYYTLLFYLDLDQFKGINDSLGHIMGDKILLAISGRLVGLLGEEVTISRLGGDEFVIVVPFIASEKNIAKQQADRYADKIQSVFSDHFIIDDIHLHIRSSMGIVLIEPNYSNTEEIIRRADISMYQAKNTNVGIAFYDTKIDKKQKTLFALQHDLAFASQNSEFDLFFQPIMDLKDNTVSSAEMLVRWRHPEHGILSPDEFIPLAIKAGILSNITWLLLDRVCEQIIEWKKNDLWKLDYVSININAQQFVENNFAHKFIQKLEHYKLDTKDIVIEITEQSIVDNFSYAQHVIDTLRKNGIRCAIDDFGTGYSSLSYLKKLSFDILKIDREFIKDAQDNKDEIELLSYILDIGKLFNYNIIIEGVETEVQKEMIEGFGHALYYQGFYISKPLSSNKFTEKFLM